MGFLPSSSAPPNRHNTYLPADYVVAPVGSGYKADFYTNGVNDDVEIQQAIDAAAALPNGGTVQLQNGTYTLGASIVPKSFVWLRGNTRRSTKIQVKTNATFAALDFRSTYTLNSPYQYGSVTDLELDGSNMLGSSAKKGIDGQYVNYGYFGRLYVHDFTATGIGMDDFYGTTIENCIANYNGYTNKHTITAASWSASTFTFTTADAHGYSVGSVIVVAGMVPLGYNNKYTVTSITNSTTFTVGTSNNAGNLTLAKDPGTATVFGSTSDSLIGHNGFGIASGANTHEANIVVNNFATGNQNNNYLIEDDYTGTDANASYIFSNNYSALAGQVGFRNTGTKNFQCNNNFDYGSPYGAFATKVAPQATITAASWSGGVATYTTSAAHNYSIGTQVVISGMTPSGYNGFYAVTTVPTTTTFTVAIVSDPGTATVFGTSSYIAHGVESTTFNNNIFSNNVLYGVRVDTQSPGVSIVGNTVKNCNNYGMQIASGNGTISGNTVSGSYLDGIYVITGSTGYMPLDQLHIVDNEVYNNNTGAGSHDGISINGAVNTPITNLSIVGNHCYDNQVTQTQRYGILINNGGTFSNFIVSNNNCVGNVQSTGILNQDGGTTIYVYNNLGVATAPGTAVAPLVDTNGNTVIGATATASAVSYVNVTNAASGGTVTLAATASAGTPNFVVKGSGTFALRPTSNSTNAIRLQDSSGSNNALVADTTNTRIAIGGTTPLATLDVRGNTLVAGNLTLNAAGNKINITTGSNASAGTATLVGGTVTVSTTAVTASSLIFLTDTASSLTNVGTLAVTAKSAGTSFTVTSSNASDTSTFNWLIIN